MKMFTLIFLLLINWSNGNYCNTEECPVSLKGNNLNITWEIKKGYIDAIQNYEIRWLSSSSCTKCNGNIIGNHTTVNLTLEFCVNYTLEIYPIGLDGQALKAPAVFSQVTASDSLKNGSVLKKGPTWAILRWEEELNCINSSFVAACKGGKNSTTESSERVVLFNISGLEESTTYVCGGYTINPAGSSAPSEPIFFQTKDSSIMREESWNEVIYLATISGLAFLGLCVLVGAYFVDKLLDSLPWRGSYSINTSEFDSASII